MAENKYTYDLATTVGQVRLYTGDNNSQKPFLWDEEITAINSNSGGVFDRTVGECLSIMATRAALRSEEIVLHGGEVTLKPGKAAEALRKQAEVYLSKVRKRPYTATQDLEDATQEVRDAMKGKYEEDFTDVPE